MYKDVICRVLLQNIDDSLEGFMAYLFNIRLIVTS